MSHPLCGQIYDLSIPSAEASHVVVLTEDLWNAQMGDSVVVPLYSSPTVSPSLFLVEVNDELRANCTRVQSMAHEFIGDWIGACTEEPWTRLRIGVRRFLDLDRRIAKTPAARPRIRRGDWRPRQNHIHFARNSAIVTTDKLYGVVSDDDWNSLPQASTVAAVRLTSMTKPQRLRWELSVDGGFVVTGDIYSIAVADFEQRAPRSGYPSMLSNDESAAIAAKQKSVLSLL